MEKIIFLALCLAQISHLSFQAHVMEGTTGRPDSRCPTEDGPTPTYLPHETRCDWFYECSGGYAILEKCPPGTDWNNDKSICDNADNVDCGNLSTATAGPTEPSEASTVPPTGAPTALSTAPSGAPTLPTAPPSVPTAPPTVPTAPPTLPTVPAQP